MGNHLYVTVWIETIFENAKKGTHGVTLSYSVPCIKTNTSNESTRLVLCSRHYIRFILFACACVSMYNVHYMVKLDSSQCANWMRYWHLIKFIFQSFKYTNEDYVTFNHRWSRWRRAAPYARWLVAQSTRHQIRRLAAVLLSSTKPLSKRLFVLVCHYRNKPIF